MIRIIDNKKIELTNEEYQYYIDMAKSYDTATRKGTDLFKNLFESDDAGIIQFLKAPSSLTSMEVVMFLMNITLHQHLRLMHSQVDQACKEVKDALTELKK